MPETQGNQPAKRCQPGSILLRAAFEDTHAADNPAQGSPPEGAVRKARPAVPPQEATTRPPCRVMLPLFSAALCTSALSARGRVLQTVISKNEKRPPARPTAAGHLQMTSPSPPEWDFAGNLTRTRVQADSFEGTGRRETRFPLASACAQSIIAVGMHTCSTRPALRDDDHTRSALRPFSRLTRKNDRLAEQVVEYRDSGWSTPSPSGHRRAWQSWRKRTCPPRKGQARGFVRDA